MKRVWTLVTASVVALGAAAHSAHAVPGSHVAGAKKDGAVTSVSVVPTTGRTEVVIGVDGAVDVQNFTLRNPDKIVVDITGATLGLPTGESYDRVTRGGILNVRYSQFRRNVVRVVLTLDAARQYSVVRGEREIRVSLQGENANFDAWTVGERPLSKATVDVVTDNVRAPLAAATDVSATAPADLAFAKNTLTTKHAPLAGAARTTTTQQRSQQPRITIAWENADIHDVLAAFAAFAGRTIIPSKDVSGKITAEITNQPWDVAMRAILNANGFDATEDANGIIVVDTFEHIASRQAAEPLSTRTFRLNYAKAANVSPMVAQRLTRDCSRAPGVVAGGNNPVPSAGSLTCPVRGAVSADSLTNSVSITDVPGALDELENYAHGLDLRQPQVNIKAKIILVDRTQLEGLGLRYDLGSGQQFFNDIIPRLDSTGKPRTDAGQVFLGGNAVSAIANATQRIPGAALQLIYSTALGNFDFSTFLEALQNTSLLDVQAEPSASVLNNRTANLTAGTQVPIRTIDANAGGNATGNFPRSTVLFRQTGVILTVTPQITNNRQIQMKVHVENSDVQFQANDVGAVFPTQQVDNEILVADGETAVMGGLTQTTVRYTKSGIPLLVDLPFIGRLFGVTTRQETKRDLLILITPHIIDEGQPAPDRSRE